MRERRIKRRSLENNFLERNYWEKKFSSSEKKYSEKNPLERTSEKISKAASWWQKIFSRFGNYLQKEWVSGVGEDIADFGKNLANSLIDWAEEWWADVLNF